MPAGIVLSGELSEVERAVRSAARALQWAIALPLASLLWWAGALWWVPLPVALSFVVHDALMRPRRNGALMLVLDADGLRMVDPLDGERVELTWSEIESARCAWRSQGREAEATVLLAGKDGPLLAIRLLSPPPPMPAEDTDLDALAPWVGGGAGAIRSLSARAARQSFRDLRALSYLREVIPQERWQITALRVWMGLAPELDFAGYHVSEHDGWLVLEEDRWELRREGVACARGRLAGASLVSSSRPWLPPSADLALLGVALPGDGDALLRVFFSSPSASRGSAVSLSMEDAHTHPGEGAALLAHLSRFVPGALERSSV